MNLDHKRTRIDASSKQTPHPVGQKKPNGLGLYDMAGNVKEKCQDLYDENYYQNSPKRPGSIDRIEFRRRLQVASAGRQVTAETVY